MKRIFIVAALAALLVVDPVFAATQEEACAQTARTARALMKARQNGLEAEKAMAPVLKMQDSPSKTALHAMVLAAYETQRWSSEAMRQRAVEDFGNEQYMACLKL